MGTQLLLPKMAAQPHHFSVHVHCGPTAGWIKMALGTEVGLGPGHVVLYRDSAPLPNNGHSPPPIFGPCLLWPNGWMDQDATWYGYRPRHRRHCVRWGPSSPQKGHSPLIFDTCLLWQNGWMHQDTTCCGGTPQPRRYCARWGPSFPLP